MQRRYNKFSKPYPRGKSSYSKGGSSMSAKQIGNIAVNAVLQAADHKEIDTYLVDSTGLNSVGTVALVSGIAEGTGLSQRVGRKVQHGYIMLDIFITSGSMSTQYDSGRISIVLDRQPNQAVAAYGDIYHTTTALAGNSFRDTTENQDRFKVLKNIQYMVAGNASTGSQQIFKHTCFISLKYLQGLDRNQTFGSNTAASVQSNSILITYGGNQVAAAFPQITYNVKYRYTDV